MKENPYSIHASTSKDEATHDLLLLLGRSIFPYKSDTIIRVQRDLLGAITWNNLSEIFTILNECANYAIIKEHEGFENNPWLNIVCDSTSDIEMLINARKTNENIKYSHYILLNNSPFYINMIEYSRNNIIDNRIYNGYYYYMV